MKLSFAQKMFQKCCSGSSDFEQLGSLKPALKVGGFLSLSLLSHTIWHVGNFSSLTRDGTCAPALGARSLKYWTTRKVS